MLENVIEDAMHQDCKIQVEQKDGKVELHVEGGKITILVLLASLEKSLFKQLKCSEKDFEAIKEVIGTEEV